VNDRRQIVLLSLASALAVAVVAGALLHSPPSRTPRPRPVAVVRATRTPPGRGLPAPGTQPVLTTVAADGGGPGAPVADLSQLTPVQEFNVSNVSAGPVRIGTTTYTDSVRFTCDSGGHDSAGDLDYVVTGYGSVSAVLGVPSEDASARGDTMTVAFFNNGTGSQMSAPFTISLGHPQAVHLRFSGSSQLVISCSAVSAASRSARYMELALGNATIGPS
jgi:hypothetical protein